MVSNNINNDDIYIQDDEGNWFYINKGVRYPAIERICKGCGKKEIIRNTTKSNYCKSCALKGLPKTSIHKRKIGKSNEGKGRGISNNHGYILKMKKDHPFANSYGYVSEHRLVMEDLVGRYLDPEEIVHHIDGDKSNNHPNNLWLFENRKEHVHLHKILNNKNWKSNYIYLAGNISQNIQTYLWREDVDRLLKEERLYKKVVIINPCANKFNQVAKNQKGTGLDFINNALEKSQHLLRPKDYQLIKMCNLMIVNLFTGTEEKPLIGTLHELCWAKDIFKMPIIGVTYGKETPYTKHPWIDECCSAKVGTVEEAVDLVKTLFLEF